MITYQSVLYYYFVILAVLVFYFLTKKFSKNHAILAINILFHLLFFYFNKIQFIHFQIYLMLNFFLLSQLQRLRLNKNEASERYFPLAITFTIVYFIVIKYFKFQIFTKFGMVGFLGFSFFTFRLISLYIDLKRKVIKEKINFLEYYNYLTFFPIYLSGPLNRFNQYVEDIRSPKENSPTDTFNYTYRIIWGIFKKTVLADYLYNFSIDSINLVDLQNLSMIKIILSMYIYSVVLYLDFSGYSDMGIGLAGLLGFIVPENFNAPFSSKNIQEFWNKWHISFMNWLKDYLYYPIQVFFLKKQIIKSTFTVSIIGYFATFLVAGLWHGIQPQYLYYGIYHGCAFTVYLSWKTFLQAKLTSTQKEYYNNSKLINFGSMVITYHYFIIGLFFFTGKYLYFFKVLKDL